MLQSVCAVNVFVHYLRMKKNLLLLFSSFTIKVSVSCYEFELKYVWLTYMYIENLLHFEDPLLEAFYFLDLQWIFNTMTNILKIPNSNGKNNTTQLAI